MKVNIKKSLFNPLILAGILLFIGSILVGREPYLLMLTAAQLIFVPVMLQLIIQIKNIHKIVTGVAMLSVFLLYVVSSDTWQIGFALIYLLFTLFVALLGLQRFFQRGFTNWAEISIDFGMMYLFIGGVWFFAYTAGIETGFSPLITWLTAIHFHYSAFLLPISLGFFGRIHESKWYPWVVSIILAGPMLVAIAITFWPLLEVISVSLYIFAIYLLIFLAFRTPFPTKLQAFCIRLSYGGLGFTILFSMLYAANNAFGNWPVSIDFMLVFHGFVNCVIFGLIGVLGWALGSPETKYVSPSFPVSRIRGKLKGTGERHRGLVDDLSVLVDTNVLPEKIIHFYEHTDQYQLFASVKWAIWFKPFVLCYKLISKKMQQLNLPISSKRIEMTGEIRVVDPILDGRIKPRVWVRKENENIIFAAIYSYHETADRTYMNIALPLPFSSMIGILALVEKENSLILTSEAKGDTGIYLASGKTLFKLPLSEQFSIEETNKGSLSASHSMRIFGIPFLKIKYTIHQK
ncbi:YndJ family protein [Fictibacillus nanhaiensis]|uniref:YndJ family protein n=1 Tax=Fictibacillus nanhaiensis TaxID=742169 RepID=UPI001C945BDB|nr:YndJ family protein [Fictibacillus nanhaiensis]MBY6037128.1 YndJ family protein [Fictibacillus nanhaiensis]